MEGYTFTNKQNKFDYVTSATLGNFESIFSGFFKYVHRINKLNK